MNNNTTATEMTAEQAKFTEVMGKPAARALDAIALLGRYTGKSFITPELVESLCAQLHAEVDAMQEELLKKPVKPGTRVVTFI